MSCNQAIGLIGAVSLAISMGAAAASPQPLVLEHKFDLPNPITGHFDDFEVDPAGQRIFATAVDSHQLVVITFNTGQLIKSIPIDTPRGVVYREDLGRLYVTDGAGALRIYDSKSYALVKSLKIEVDADPIAYDPANGHVFAVNGGDKAGHKYSHITVFDSLAERQIANMRATELDRRQRDPEYREPEWQRDRGHHHSRRDPEDQPRTRRGPSSRHPRGAAAGGTGQADGRPDHFDGDRHARQDDHDVDADRGPAALRAGPVLRGRR